MARVTLERLQSVANLEELRRFVSKSLEAITLQFNGRVDLVDNLRSVVVEVSLTSTPLAIGHGLGRVPTGSVVMSQDAAGNVIRPDRTVFPWTDNQIFLSSTSPLRATILIV